MSSTRSRRSRVATAVAAPVRPIRPARRRSSRAVPVVVVDEAQDLPSYCIDLTCDDEDISIVDLTTAADSPDPPIPVLIPELDEVVIPPPRRRRRSQTPNHPPAHRARTHHSPVHHCPHHHDATVLIDDTERTPSPEVVISQTCEHQRPPAEESPREKVICPVCMDTANQIRQSGRSLMSTVCGHIFCATCITEAQRLHKCCPTCRKRLGPKQFHPLFL